MALPLDQTPSKPAPPVAGKAAAKLAASHPKPADARPAKPGAIAPDRVEVATEPTLGQSFKIEHGKIHATNTVKIDADPERVLAALEDDWSKWWPGSKRGPAPEGAGLPKPVKHEARFQFTPLASDPRTTYVVQQFEATAEPISCGQLMMVVPHKLTGTFEGDARFEVRVTPDGKTLLTSKWNGMAPAGFAAWGPMPEMVARAHLMQETRAFEALGAWIKQHP